MGAKIVLLEDDDLVAEWIRDEIYEFIQSPRENVLVIPTEGKFRDWIRNTNRSIPYIFILDMRVRGTTPSAEMPEVECNSTDPMTAGIRCLELIQNRFVNPKVIVFSVQTKDALLRSHPETATILEKANAFYSEKADGLSPVIRQIEKLLGTHHNDNWHDTR